MAAIKNDGRIEIENCRELGAELFRDGFLAIDNITNADDIRSIREEIVALLSERNARKSRFRNLGDAVDDSGEATILEMISPSAACPRLLDSLFFRRALQFSRAILGASARLQYEHCLSKPPFSPTETAWHQDCAYQRIQRSTRRLHWWLPLQDVSTDNGCMQFVPGSHLGPVLAHARRSAGGIALRTNLPAVAEPVACPLDVGGATIHLPRTLHYTGQNNSAAPRHAWILQIGFKGWNPLAAS